MSNKTKNPGPQKETPEEGKNELGNTETKEDAGVPKGLSEEPESSSNTPKEPSAEEKLRGELGTQKDQYLRLLAEYDNFRKRSARERENIYSDVKADTLEKLLPVYDSLELALAHEKADETYCKGLEMIMNQFVDALNALGVTAIEAVGKTFDPQLHNAVMHVEDENAGENEVVRELRKGFKLGDRVIRFSMVQVAN